MSDIAELFATDPLRLSSTEFIEEWKAKTGLRPIEQIVAKYREARTQFTLGVKAAGATKKIKEKQPKITNLDDILGDIT